MKILLLVCVFIGNITVLFSQPVAWFRNKNFSFGEIKEDGGKAACIFYCVNKGDESLVIDTVIPACGCTSAGWTRGQILPGDSAFIKAEYDPDKRVGTFNKAIAVVTNDPVETRTILYIDGTVIPRVKTLADEFPMTVGNLRFKNNHLAFGEIFSYEIKTDSLPVYNNWDQPMKIGFKYVPDFLKVSARPAEIPPKSVGYIIVAYDAPGKDDYGLNFDRFRLKTNDSLLSEKLVNVSAEIVEDFSSLTEKERKNAPVISLDNEKINFGKGKEGEKIRMQCTISNNGKRDLIIRKMKPACGCTVPDFKSNIIRPGESITGDIVFYTLGKKGGQHKTITIISNDPERPSIYLHIQGEILPK